MAQMQLRTATRQKAKIRLGLSAVSGGGKTISALLIAYGMTGDWSKIALIDTENDSADLYANHNLKDGTFIGEFQKISLNAPYTPERYVEAIGICEAAPQIEVIIIDSITHEWEGKGGCLEIQGAMTGNSYTNWAKVTPRHAAFIDAILKSRCHVITTVRRKQDYEINTDSNGKKIPVKVGLKEVTREGFEYEVTANLEIDVTHYASCAKDRTGLFADRPAFIPSVETGKMLLTWCETGTDPATEINDAIAKLPMCSTVDELSLFKDGLETKVKTAQQFKDAALARYYALQPAK